MNARREDVYARAHADQKAGVERGKRCRRADGAQRVRAGELPDDGDVRHVEQYLQQVRRHQRQAEDQYLLPEIPARHVTQIVPHGNQASSFQILCRTLTRRLPYYSTENGNLATEISDIFLHKKHCRLYPARLLQQKHEKSAPFSAARENIPDRLARENP